MPLCTITRLGVALVLLTAPLLGACSLCQTEEPTTNTAGSPRAQPKVETPRVASDESPKKVDAVGVTTPSPAPSPLQRTQVFMGADLRDPALLQGRQRPWTARFGEDYIAFADALVAQGYFFGCSSVDGLVAAKLSGQGTLENIRHLGPDHADFKRYPDGGKSSRCGRLAAGYGFLYVVHRGDSFLDSSYMALYSLSAKVPTLVHVEFPTQGTFSSVAVGPHRVFVGMEGRGVQVFEKKNGRLEPRGMLPGVKHTTDLTYWAGRLYVASGGRGLFVYDVTDTRKESLLGHLRVDATILSLAIHPWSSTLYIMAGSRGMATVSIRDPKNPKIMGWIPTKGPALRANATRSHLALVDYESLRLFSLENPKKPTLAARRRIPAGKGGALTLAVTSRGQHVYAASWYGLEVYRVDLQQRAPIAEFATRDIELEPKGDEFEAVFRIKNTGSSPLEVRFAEASHDLFVLPKPVTLPSGKESLLRITTRTRLPAGETGGITLRTNDPHEPTVRLSVRTKRTMDSWAAWAQTVEFQRESKGTFGLQAHRGKVIVLAYFASFCPPCFKEFPELERDIWAPFRNQGVRLFGVSGPTDGPSNITRFREQTGVTFDLVSSAAPPTKLATPGTMVTYYPFHVVIGADGSVRYVGTDLNTGKLVKEVRHALREAVEKETAK